MASGDLGAGQISVGGEPDAVVRFSRYGWGVAGLLTARAHFRVAYPDQSPAESTSIGLALEHIDAAIGELDGLFPLPAATP